MTNTAFRLRSLTFKNRVLVASGTFGYGDETRGMVDLSKLGGIVTKSLSLKPREGNPPRRIAETPSGMLNSIGLANIGVHRFIREKLPFLREAGTAVVANIAASSVDEYCSVLDLLEEAGGVDAFEINVSCPNVKEGGLNFGTSCPAVAEITRRLRVLTKKPLVIKLTPNVTHIAEFARAAEGEGADALSVINTVIGMAVDVQTRRPLLSTVTGGLSGPAIKPIALAKVYEVVKAVQVPVIGMGGIQTTNDALEFLVTGASLVQVGTQNFVEPDVSVKIAKGIRDWCEERGIADVGDVVGSLKAEVSASILESWL
jgi:dihydroorotate dehydrogenase (NAD+) catalytic subunit